ncbi:hypothetical protein ACIBQ1_40285 [Nonomuraea sp. NPDC050153]|uniref:hypothetical protein n=1 Tax=Nonomuraea sp. NPDC050153 TaxID=3364359 RepID=UPI0037906C73
MFDVVIVGGAPAGMAAALTLGRVHPPALLIDTGQGRNATADNVLPATALLGGSIVSPPAFPTPCRPWRSRCWASGSGCSCRTLVVVAQNAASPADLAATTSAVVSVRGVGLSLGVAVFGTLLSRELQGRAPGPAATAAAIPDVLFWGAPAAAVLVALPALLPRKAQGEATA